MWLFLIPFELSDLISHQANRTLPEVPRLSELSLRVFDEGVELTRTPSVLKSMPSSVLSISRQSRASEVCAEHQYLGEN